MSEWKASEVEQPGYRNGYGKPRRFTLSMGTPSWGKTASGEEFG